MLRGCLGFLQTSTYQAVLTTDGNRSFALLLYQDGGMRWDYAKLAEGNVLIGFSRCRAHVWLPFGTAGISPSTMLGPWETLSQESPAPTPGAPRPTETLSPANCSSSHPSCSTGGARGSCWEGDPKPPFSTQR